ncbi:MAG TPA: helix-turn-helix domain-containing protein [Candidatus Nitrosopolaris sp.]|nr:helix-turn-helix domain-containing protein [Candidatus Nitrosopolaris sp.]
MFNQLQALDLSPAERTAYETLITHGPMAPPQLAKAANLTRVNSYAALRGLSQKELAAEKDVNKKRVYSPAPPTKLQELARQKTEVAKASQESIDAIIPTLMNQFALVSGQPGISHYESLDGIKQIYEDSLRPPHHQESLVLRSIYDSKEIEPYILKYIRRRAKLGIKNRMLTPYFDTSLDDKALLRERRFLPKEKFSLPTEISIYGDKVSLVSLRKDLIGSVIQSKDVAQTFRILFELLWSQASTEKI